MEQMLDVYRRPYQTEYPVVCMDETPHQLIGETRAAQSACPGEPCKVDYEYRRMGACNVFIAAESLAGTRMTNVTKRRTKCDFAHFVRDIAQRYESVKTITLVMDNLNTHRPGAFYEVFEPAHTKALWDRFEFVYKPKHGSWLNVAEAEISVMSRQCLNRRIDSIDEVRNEVCAWAPAVGICIARIAAEQRGLNSPPQKILRTSENTRFRKPVSPTAILPNDGDR